MPRTEYAEKSKKNTKRSRDAKNTHLHSLVLVLLLGVYGKCLRLPSELLKKPTASVSADYRPVNRKVRDLDSFETDNNTITYADTSLVEVSDEVCLVFDAANTGFSCDDFEYIARPETDIDIIIK
ncbi:hypothetical protein DAMA08_041860 [Martiniozyma asiatica (nom. inval.)]|nr:hypothetical protein DAMA08_041860 [Martiniozyma asiatica]